MLTLEGVYDLRVSCAHKAPSAASQILAAAPLRFSPCSRDFMSTIARAQGS